MPDQNSRQITAQEAIIKTTTVEIRTLTLNGKQMTLSVFRQLREEPVIDEDTLELRGQPWGTVNYHPDADCKAGRPHLHVVWQKGAELRRATVLQIPWLRDETEPSGHAGRREWMVSACEVYVILRTLEGWFPATEARSTPFRSRNMGDYWWTYLPFELDAGPRLELPFTDDLRTHLQVIWNINRQHREADTTFHTAKAALKKSLSTYEEKLGANPSAADVRQRMVQPALQEYQHYRKHWAELYQQFEALSQLFIAV
jgi:hypothetical protein